MKILPNEVIIKARVILLLGHFLLGLYYKTANTATEQKLCESIAAYLKKTFYCSETISLTSLSVRQPQCQQE